MHTGGDLTGAGELQHTVQGQLLIQIGTGKLGPNDQFSDLKKKRRNSFKLGEKMFFGGRRDTELFCNHN